jgi:putative endonuclease
MHLPIDDSVFLQAHAAQQLALRRTRRQTKQRASAKKIDPFWKENQARCTAKKHQTNPTAKIGSPKQSIGNYYEDQANQLLARHGCVLLARQLRCKAGEIDLIMRKNDTLIFVEVRRRNTVKFGGCAASITTKKQARLIKTAQWHLGKLVQTYFGGRTPPCRFDVVAFEGKQIQWLRNTITLEVSVR